MIRPGFSFIEIIIALAISSFVMLMIFNAISVIQRSTIENNNYINCANQQEILFKQLKKDISGIVVPLYGFIPLKKDKPEEQKKKQDMYNKSYGLHIEIEGEQFKSLSFVTTSILKSYGVPRPLLARVRYHLVPEQESLGFFTLMREESAEISPENFISRGSYPIAFGLKTCTINCTIIQNNADGKKVEVVSGASFAESIKMERNQAHAGKEKHQKIALPQIISLKGTMGTPGSDKVTAQEYPFAFSCWIPVDPANSEPEKKLPQPEPNANDQKSAQKPGKKTSPLPEQKRMPLMPGVKK